MAIIIEHMEMPNGCCECRMERENCCTLSLRRIDDVYDRPEWCLLIEAEPVKHGRWAGINTNRYGDQEATCSVCGATFASGYSNPTWWDYCPNCGAKMDLTE